MEREKKVELERERERERRMVMFLLSRLEPCFTEISTCHLSLFRETRPKKELLLGMATVDQLRRQSTCWWERTI